MIKAAIGITINCAKTPPITERGFFKTSLKSTGFKVSPIPNITTPKRIVIYWPKNEKESGIKNAITAKTITKIAKYLPASAIIFSNIFKYQAFFYLICFFLHNFYSFMLLIIFYFIYYD